MTLTLLDWRRRVAALYADVRAAEDPESGWTLWRTGRDALLGTHPDSPLDAAARSGFTGVPMASYDPAVHIAGVVLNKFKGGVLSDGYGVESYYAAGYGEPAR